MPYYSFKEKWTPFRIFGLKLYIENHTKQYWINSKTITGDHYLDNPFKNSPLGSDPKEIQKNVLSQNVTYFGIERFF